MVKGGYLKFNMNAKKAQSQIITTVLIILLVLAAIVIVWQVVNSTIKEGAEELESQSSCLGINLEIVSTVADSTTPQLDPATGEVVVVDGVTVMDDVLGSVTVTRGAGKADVTITEYVVLVDGANVGSQEGLTLGPLESDTYEVSLTSGAKVEVAPVIGETTCPASSSATVA